MATSYTSFSSPRALKCSKNLHSYSLLVKDGSKSEGLRVMTSLPSSSGSLKSSMPNVAKYSVHKVRPNVLKYDDLQNFAAEQNSQDSSPENGNSVKLDANGISSERSLPKPLSVANQHLSLKKGTSTLRVAYQGVPGAYSEAAAVKAYPDCEPVPCDQFEAAFQALELWLVDRAVLPIENSLGGSIHRNYDLMLRHKVHIVGEVQLPVHHCLLALPGTKIENLVRVMSHPQALAQCEATLTKLGVTRESVLDTAGAAQTISTDKICDAGAIASSRAAEIYGLEVLADGIQDDDDNVTRFLILAREPIMPQAGRPWKTSIVFSLEIGPGVLFKALSVFALRDINLTKIESRPQKNKELLETKTGGCARYNALVEDAREKGYHLFDYLFYIDFQASMAEERAQNALRHLQEFTPFLRVLGSYPMDVSPNAKL